MEVMNLPTLFLIDPDISGMMSALYEVYLSRYSDDYDEALRLINILQSQLSPSMSNTAWLVCTKTTQLLWLTWVYASYRTCLATSLPKFEPHYSPTSHPRGFFGFTLLTCTIPTQQLKILDQLHFPTPFYYQTFLELTSPMLGRHFLHHYLRTINLC